MLDQTEPQSLDTLSTPVEPAAPDPAEQAEKARNAAQIKVQRGALNASRGGSVPDESAPMLTDPKQFVDLPPGTKWRDPEGGVHFKPYAPTSLEDFRRVPEGAQWQDPEGNLKTKPTYGDIDFTPQTLYNMSSNDVERKKALEKYYPGNVFLEEGTNELYVKDKEGKQLKPRGIFRSPFSSIAGGAAPAVGAIAGEIGGGLLAGGLTEGVGTIPGAIAGGGAGAAIGQGFNDLFLKAAGIYDRSFDEEKWNLIEQTLLGSGGSAAGKVLGFGVAGGGAGAAGIRDPKKFASIINSALGTDPAALDFVLAMKAKGLERTPIGPLFPEAPALINASDVYLRAFKTQDPIMQAVNKYAEGQGRGILGRAGVPETEITGKTGSLFNPTAEVPTKETGELVKSKAREELNAIESDIRELHRQLQGGYDKNYVLQPGAIEQRKATEAALKQAYKDERGAATRFLQEGYQKIDNYIADAFKTAKIGGNNGKFWRDVSDELKGLRATAGAEANKQYGAWEQKYGHIPVPESVALSEDAQNFMSMMPPEFRQRYPGLIRDLGKLAGVYDENGALVEAPKVMNLGELQKLRAVFRSGIDWQDLRSDLINGQKKFFEGKINNLLSNPLDRSPKDFARGGAPPEWAGAAADLKEIDKWFAQTMDIWNDRSLNAVIKGVRNGEPADPRELYDTIIKSGRTDFTKELERMLGPNIWAGIKGIDAQEIMRSAMMLKPGQVDGQRFISEILARHRDGMLESIHGKKIADSWVKQAIDVGFDRRLPAAPLQVEIPPDADISHAMDLVRQAHNRVIEFARTDPVKLLQTEMKRLQTQAKDFKNRPNAFMYDTNFGAEEAAKKILESPQNIYAAAKVFPPDSAEWKALQRTWTWSLLQNEMDPTARLQKFSPEIQRLMMPGITLDEVHLFAKEMHFLLGTKAMQETAKSMAAQNLVNNPLVGMPVARTVAKLTPGANFAARALRAFGYDQLNKGLTSQAFLELLKRGITSSDPAARAAAKRALSSRFNRFMQAFGAAGAGGMVGNADMTTEPAPVDPSVMQQGNQGDTEGLPHFAEGGEVPPGQDAVVGDAGTEVVETPTGSAMVGQAGPQVINLPEGGEVIPNEELSEPEQAQAAREAAAATMRQHTQPPGGRADIPPEHIAEGLVTAAGGPIGRGVGLAGRGLMSAVRAAPKISGAIGSMVTATMAGNEGHKPESFQVELPPPDSTLVAARQQLLTQKQQAEAEYQKRRTAPKPAGVGPQTYLQAQQRDAEAHAGAMQRIDAEIGKADDKILAEQHAQQRGKQEELAAAADKQSAKEAAEKPLIDKYPALVALPYLGAAFAGGTSYTMRARAVGAYNEWVGRLNSAIMTAEKATAKGTPIAEKRYAADLLAQQMTEHPEMQQFVNPKLWKAVEKKLGAAFGGAALAAELAAVPSQIDWATQAPETAAGKQAHERLFTLEGILKLGMSAFAGVTGATVGSSVPTRAAKELPDLARAKAASKAVTPPVKAPPKPKAKPAEQEPRKFKVIDQDAQ